MQPRQRQKHKTPSFIFFDFFTVHRTASHFIIVQLNLSSRLERARHEERIEMRTPLNSNREPLTI